MNNRFYVGQKSSIEKIFSEEEVLLFSKISMDTNPVHFDNKYASTTRFGKPIVQGPYITMLIGGILGSTLPGPGTVYITQTINFRKPVHIGEKITINVEILTIRTDKPIMTLRTWAEKNDSELVMDGEAKILFLNTM